MCNCPLELDLFMLKSVGIFPQGAIPYKGAVLKYAANRFVGLAPPQQKAMLSQKT
jgi:hypothetical protein